jgi:hypothetical protein
MYCIVVVILVNKLVMYRSQQKNQRCKLTALIHDI